MSNKPLKIKMVTSLSSIIARLEFLVESLKKGYLAVTTPGKVLILQPQDPIRLHMAAVKTPKEGANQQLSIKIKWQRQSDAWRSMFRMPTENPLSGTLTAATNRSADDAPPSQEDITGELASAVDTVAGEPQNKAQSREKPPRNNALRKTAPKRGRKTNARSADIPGKKAPDDHPHQRGNKVNK